MTAALDLDRRVAAGLNGLARRWAPGARIVKFLASWLSAAEVGLMLALVVLGKHGAMLRTLASVGVVYGLVEAISRLWSRGRPFDEDQTVQPLVRHAPERSFPSRHVASAVAMAQVAGRASPPTGRAMGALALALAVARVAAGLHYPSDAVAGAGLGLLVGRWLRQ